jgi:hypothetical protein
LPVERVEAAPFKQWLPKFRLQRAPKARGVDLPVSLESTNRNVQYSFKLREINTPIQR